MAWLSAIAEHVIRMGVTERTQNSAPLLRHPDKASADLQGYLVVSGVAPVSIDACESEG